MAYRSELEARIAKKTTKAIVDYQMIEDGDRVMVGLVGRQGQLGAAADARRPAPARADAILAGRRQRRLRLQGIQARPHRQDVRGARLGVPDRAHRHRRADRGHPRRRPDAVLAVRPAAPRRAVPDREGGRRDEDRARPSRRRLHRDAAAEPVLRRRAQGHAGQAGVRRWRARRDPAAGLRRRRRGARCTRRSASCRSSAAAARRAATSGCSGSGPSGC